MTTLSRIAMLLVAGCCACTPLLAQGESSDIVVTAQMTADEIGKASHEMARTLTSVPVSDQVPRWTTPVCVRVDGLDPPLSLRVAAAIKSIGTAAKVKLAKPRCNPNVFVIFTTRASELASEVANRLPLPDDGGGRVERAAFKAAKGPLRWETRVSIHSADTGPMTTTSAALMSNTDPYLAYNVPMSDATSASLIRKQTKAAIDGMTVIVDGNAAAGMELDQLAEYIAMVVFARPPMSASFEKHASILNLVKHQPPASNPQRLTEWDRAYLAALYAAPLDRSASATRSIIAKRMADQLSRDN